MLLGREIFKIDSAVLDARDNAIESYNESLQYVQRSLLP